MPNTKTAIERLHELLDERGVEWKAHGYENHTWWSNNENVGWHAENRPVIRGLYVKVEAVLTPEQAIAATLGGGRLTAEQVHELIAPHLHARPTFDFGHHGAVWSADFQAIADELNATLGPGTCHNSAPSYLDFLCSKCGFVHYHSDENDSGEGNEWRYCPNCGRKVVGE